VKDDLELFLAASGGGVFIDPTRLSGATVSSILWIERSPGESETEYMLRVSKMTPNLGVTVGRNQLGCRSKREANALAHRVWIAENFPPSWGADVVESALHTPFTDVEMLKQQRNKGQSDFYFRASSTGDRNLVAIKEEGKGTATFWARWAPPKNRVGPTKEVRNDFSRPLTESVTGKLNTLQIVADAKSTPGAGETPNSNGEPPKGQSANKRVRAAVRAIPPGTKMEVVTGDGGCLFHAFSLAMATTTGKSAANALTLRSEAVAHLKKHKERYLNDCDGVAPCGRRLWSHVESVEAKGTAFDTDLKEVSSPTAWSGELEASALARKCNIKVVIVPKKLDFVPAALHNVGTHVIALWFLGAHFDALVPESGSELPEDVRAVTDGLFFFFPHTFFC